ncbi:hypothetical protein FACS189452_05330 [Bacteroidia bacterium]|nr:hypothetical protein FACS189452_05330 [Bacteroidia bacterium]GHT81049.1 hypothetical protein FACS189467_4450 [Bacteroidia bacterium]
MKTDKFTDKDRTLVLEELERIQKCKLTQVKPSRKLYTDENGMPFLIFGGGGDWHGITEKGMNEVSNYVRECKREGAFVVVKKYNSKMVINVGNLSVFLLNKHRLQRTNSNSYQFHCILSDEGLYLLEIPDLVCNNWSEILFPNYKRDLSRLKEISKIINIEVNDSTPLTHSDIEAKLLLIGSYLNYRTYTPDRGKQSIYGLLGDLCTEKEVPTESIPKISIEKVREIDVIWFDEEGYPTHAFEVEHSTDVTKGLLRLYQIHKLRIRLYIIAGEDKRTKFEKEVSVNPFHKIKEEYIFKNYQELDEFFESVKQFTKVQEKFLKKIVI